MMNLLRRWRIRRAYRALCEAYRYSAERRARMDWWGGRI